MILNVTFMNIHFISDDVYFVLGLTEVFKNTLPNCYFYNINVKKMKFNPNPDDLVVVIIENIHLRHKLLCNHQLKQCRLIFFVDVNMKSNCFRMFPWLLQKKICINSFINIIKKSMNTSIHYQKINKKSRDIFEGLCHGMSVAEVSKYNGDSVSTTYYIKRCTLIRYGLFRCNSKGLFVCRDLLSIY